MIKDMRLSLLAGTAATLLSTTASAQILLAEDFQDVTGITAATTVRTIQSILTDAPNPLDGNPVASFSNTGNGNASALSFNVRRWDNAIDGSSGSANFGDSDFDNFFGSSPNQFLVRGDNSGNVGGSANGGTSAGASSTMAIRFALDPIIGSPLQLIIGFDYVFDANNIANPDDFLAELILADSSTVSLLNFGTPSVSTRGNFSTAVPYASLSSAPAFLNFRLIEGEDNGSSAIGLDNLQVAAVPEPGALALLGIGLLGLRLARSRSN